MKHYNYGNEGRYMGKKTYEMIPVKKPIEKEALLNNISMYLYSRLENCQIGTTGL